MAILTLPHGVRAPGMALGILFLLCSSLAGAGPVNINTADASTLSRELKGIGAKRAQAIVDYRKAHGPFRSADELGLVKGIGPAAIDKNRADIRVDVKCDPGPCGNGAKSRTPKSNNMAK
jgi:competence ComEA-like helix-hairpin-helix protein